MPASILVVDDDPLFRQVVTDVLTAKGHRVIAVENATLALEEHAKQTFEVVLTDLIMPGVDGLQLLARLRERDPLQEVILVSGRNDSSAWVAATQAGVAHMLLKPVLDSELVLAVQRSLERVALRRERARLIEDHAAQVRLQEVHLRGRELLASTDLEWISERAMSELASVSEAKSAALWLGDDRGSLVLKGYQGLLERRFLMERIEPGSAIAERMKLGEAWVSGTEPCPALYLPLIVAEENIGLLQVSDPLQGRFGEEQLERARVLAKSAGLALRNGRRFLALQRHGLRDRDTAAYNLSYFTDYCSKEIYKARRYGRTFSLLTFAIDHLQLASTRLGHDAARRATRGITRALSRIIRDSDVLAKATEQDFYLLLPETDFFGATMFLRRAMAAARDEPDVSAIEQELSLGLVGGAATYPKDGEDFDELVHRCRRRADERRASLQRKLMLDPLPFWDVVGLLLGSAQSPRLPADDHAEPSRRGKVANLLFEELQTEVARELVRDPSARGLLYLGVKEIGTDLPIAIGLDRVPHDFGFRVYVLGRRADLDSHPSLTPVFLEGDEQIARHEFLFWLSENAAYALIQRRGRGATWGFHSSDTAVVEGLITKLQTQYDLQPY